MSKWYNLEDKTPKGRTVCMVAYEFHFKGEIDTHYARAIWFNEHDNIKTNDGSIEVISRSGFYVPIDHRPLGLHFAMLIPNIKNVLSWQENNAPYIPKEFESWKFELLETEQTNKDLSEVSYEICK